MADFDEFVTAAVYYVEANGIGSFPTVSGARVTSGVVLFDGKRRDGGDLPGGRPDTIALFRQSAGEGLIFDTSEEYGFQVLVDSETVSGARAVSRLIYNLLNDTRATVISGFELLWLRGIAPPQDIGDGPGSDERFIVSTNYTARILR